MNSEVAFYIFLLDVKEYFKKPFSYYRLRDYSRVADYLASKSVNDEMVIEILAAIQDFTETSDYFVENADFKSLFANESLSYSFKHKLPQDIGTAKRFANRFLEKDFLGKQKELFEIQDFASIERLLEYETILPVSVLNAVEKNTLDHINKKIETIETNGAQDLIDNEAFSNIRKQLNSAQVNDQFELLVKYQKDPSQKQRDEEEKRRIIQREVQRQQRQQQREQRRVIESRRHVDDSGWDGSSLWRFIPLSLFLISIVGRCYRVMENDSFSDDISFKNIRHHNANSGAEEILLPYLLGTITPLLNGYKFVPIDTIKTGQDVFFQKNIKEINSLYNQEITFHNETDFEVVIFNVSSVDMANGFEPYSIYVAPHDSISAKLFYNKIYIGEEMVRGEKRGKSDGGESFIEKYPRFLRVSSCTKNILETQLNVTQGSLHLQTDGNAFVLKNDKGLFYGDNTELKEVRLCQDDNLIKAHNVSLRNND